MLLSRDLALVSAIMPGLQAARGNHRHEGAGQRSPGGQGPPGQVTFDLQRSLTRTSRPGASLVGAAGTCSEEPQFEAQRARPVSQDIHTLGVHVTKETSQRHHWSSAQRRGGGAGAGGGRGAGAGGGAHQRLLLRTQRMFDKGNPGYTRNHSNSPCLTG